MTERVFLDSNVLLYASTDDERSAAAQILLQRPYDISVQILNEFVHVARRKLRKDWADIDYALARITATARVIHPLTFATHRKAVALAKRHMFSIYDALVVTSALEGDCDTLLSEDMHHGLVVDGKLTILNPFA